MGRYRGDEKSECRCSWCHGVGATLGAPFGWLQAMCPWPWSKVAILGSGTDTQLTASFARCLGEMYLEEPVCPAGTRLT